MRWELEEMRKRRENVVYKSKRYMLEHLVVLIVALSLLPFLFDLLVLENPRRSRSRSEQLLSGEDKSHPPPRIQKSTTGGIPQSYCPIPNVTLDKKWKEYFEGADKVVHECPQERRLGIVESMSSHEHYLVPLPGACAENALIFHFLDKSTFDFASIFVRGRVLLPSDSGILRCEEAGREASNLILKPTFNHERHQRAKQIEKDLLEDQEKTEEDGEASYRRPNILFVMIDSLSHNQAIRSLPQTLAFLRSGGERRTGRGFRTYEFDRFNVVSSGTHNNVPAYLAGRRYSELLSNKNETDEWILEEAARNGYVTAFVDGEYVSSKSSLPRVRLKTFEEAQVDEPTMRTVLRVAESMGDHSVHSIFDKVLDFSSDPHLRSFGTPTKRLCFGGGSIFGALAGYIKDFWRSYEDVAKMAYMAVMDAHEPSLLRARQIDIELRDFLQDVMRGGGRETVVFLCGDHGIWYGEFYEDTKVGRLEAKLPALFLLLPQQFVARNPELAVYATSNQPKLTTPYDVHATLRHIINMHSREVERIKPSPHAISLLDSHAAFRTCHGANIPWEHCSCVEFEAVESELLHSIELRSLGTWAMEFINDAIEKSTGGDLTANKTSCVPLRFGSNLWAETLETELMDDDEADGVSMTILKVTSQGSEFVTNETFEATFFRKALPLREDLRPAQRSIVNGITLRFIQIGRGYEESTKISQDAIQIFTPGEHVLIYFTQNWVAVEKEFRITSHWIKPNKETWKYSVSTVKKAWSMSWQREPILLTEEETEGLWTVEVYLTSWWDGKQHDYVDFTATQLVLGPLMGRTKFYLASDGGGSGKKQRKAEPKIATSAVLQEFWKLSQVSRISPYAKHEVCRDMRVLPDFCVCTI